MMSDLWRYAQNIEDTLDGTEGMPGGAQEPMMTPESMGEYLALTDQQKMELIRDNERLYAIRKSVLNCTIDQWKVIDSMNLDEVTVDEFAAKVGKCGFLTALLNEQEREFVAKLWEDRK